MSWGMLELRREQGALFELARHEAATGNIQKVEYLGEWHNVRRSMGLNVFSVKWGSLYGAPCRITVALRDFIAPDSIWAIQDIICENNTCETLKQLIKNHGNTESTTN